MTESQIKICHIRQVSSIDDSFLGFTRTYRNHYAAYVGDRIVAKSNEWQIKTSDYGGNASSQQKVDERLNQQREVSYQEVFQKLVAEGWEPIGTDEEGRFMSFRKTPILSKSQTDFVTELERLSQLKKQGLLTEKEFEAAKNKLLQ